MSASTEDQQQKPTPGRTGESADECQEHEGVEENRQRFGEFGEPFLVEAGHAL